MTDFGLLRSAPPLGRRLAAAAWTLGFVATLGTGCVYTRAQSDTPRTATEQLLLTRSMEQVVAEIELPEVAGRPVALEMVSLAEGDTAYLRSELEEALRKAGAILVAPEAADWVLVGFVGTLGTVSRGLDFGIPPIPLGFHTVPGLPLLRFLKQRGYTKLRLAVRDSEGRHVAEHGPVIERAFFEVYNVLFFALRRNDIYPGEELEIAVD